jgi:aspartate-semialdehyde dehydrogenase
VEERPFPAIELKLFEPQGTDAAALSQFQDEVVVTQPVDPDLFPSLDVMFVGNAAEETIRLQATAAAREGVLTFLAESPRIDAPVAALGLNDRFLSPEASLLVAPRAESILVAKVLDALAGSFEIAQACATALLPASELGDEAVRELHEQVVQLLSFKTPPSEVLGEQLAFNLNLPVGKGLGESREESVTREVCDLSGLETGTITVSLIRAPIFHSYALSLWVQLSNEPDFTQVSNTLAGHEGIDFSPPSEPMSSVATPVSVSGSEEIHVGRLRPDSSRPGAYWFWVVADGLAVDAASNALSLAEKLLEARDSSGPQ